MAWVPEFDVTAGQARELIASQFPHIAATTVERFGAGMDNIAYLVDEQYVFRFPRRERVVRNLEIETRILPMVAPHLPQRVPVPLYAGSAGHVFPWMFAGYERLRGVTACSIALERSERAALAPDLGRFLRALHALDPAPLIAAGIPYDELGRLDHTTRLPLAQERFAELDAQGAVRQTLPFIRFMEDHPPQLSELPRTVVHGDLYARHMLLDRHNLLCGVIDWGDVHIGYPALDLMAAHSMLPPEAHGAFFNSYGTVEPNSWDAAKYRAIYHCALVMHFALEIEDPALLDAGATGLSFIRETL